MHKNTSRRSVSGTQKIKAPQHLAHLKEDEKEDSRSSHFRLPSLQKKSWKDVTDSPSSWDQNSTPTSVSWSEEVETVGAPKLLQEWDAIERTLYEEEGKLSEGPIYDECLQWKTQIPHLRIVGKNVFPSGLGKTQDSATSVKSISHFSANSESNLITSRSLSAKETVDSPKRRSLKKARDNVLNILVEYVYSELFPNKENDVDAISENLSDVLTITPAPVRSSKNITRDSFVTDKEKNLYKNLENRYSSAMTKLPDTPELPSTRDSQRRSHSMLSNKRRDSNAGDMLEIDEQVDTRQYGRNKLGTVFNQRIVVSPVPFIVSTRESFSTLRTTPIKFIGEPLEISNKLGSSKGIISNVKTPNKKLNATLMPGGNSAWQTPVFPKNIKLAPIDTSQLPSNKNRSLAPSPTTIHRNRKPLSPISRSTLPATAHLSRSSDKEILEIEGKRIISGQSAKSNLRASAWNNSPRNGKSKRKKSQGKIQRQ